jgi:hypothetical protein
VTSNGNNIVGDIGNCSFSSQGSDQRRDPRLGDFVDPRLPGQGRFPLLVNSPAINAGDDCSSVDQLENVRNGQCDIRGQWNFTRWLMS